MCFDKDTFSINIPTYFSLMIIKTLFVWCCLYIKISRQKLWCIEADCRLRLQTGQRDFNQDHRTWPEFTRNSSYPWNIATCSGQVTWIEGLRNFYKKTFFSMNQLFHAILASKGCFWPLTASMTSKVKINYAYVTTQDICNKFIEVKFSVGCMVWVQNHLFQDWTSLDY